MRGAAATLLLAIGLAPAAFGQPAPLMVVYGPEAPSREGDPDHVERVFVSVPADLPERLYLRVFDPEPAGAHDTRYGRSRTPTSTLFRLSGGDGARTGVPLPTAIADGAGPDATADPGRRRGFAGGRVIAERRFDEAAATDDTWVTLAPFSAADGEVIDGEAWLRLDVVGEAGDYGNAFTVEVEPVARPLRPGARRRALLLPADGALARGRATRPRCASTLRPARRSACRASTAPRARSPSSRPSTSAGSQASGQDEWRVAPFEAPGGPAAITLRGGLGDPERRHARRSSTPTARRSRSRCRRGRRQRRRAPTPSPRRGRWRTAPRSPSTPRPRPATVRSPITGASATAARATRRSSPIPTRRPAATRPSSTCSAAATQIGRGARVDRAGARAGGAGGRGGRAGDRRARRAGRLRRRRLGRRATARSPASTGASATAPRPRAPRRPTPTRGRGSTAPCCGSRTTPTTPATSASRPGS